MESYIKKVEVRWGDLDPNFHMQHARYYEFGAYIRMAYLTEMGFTPAVMTELQIGPILFREECLFRKEIRFEDSLSINLMVSKLKRDASRWSFRHHLIKNDKVIAAILNVDGAWMDLQKRKLGKPPSLGIEVFETMPRTEDFVWLD